MNGRTVAAVKLDCMLAHVRAGEKCASYLL
jgi:hypothetical protein